MLKGSADIDIEFMGGTIIFVTLTMVLIGSLLLPMFSVSYTRGDTGNDIKAIKFASLVKNTLESELPRYGGGIDADLLETASESGLSSFGLGDNYASVRDITAEREWEFPGKDGKLKHETFSTVSSYYLPAVYGNIMKSGEAYVIDIYKVGPNTVVDIYTEPYCSINVPLTLTCKVFTELVPEDKDASSISDVIMEVFNDAATRNTKLIIPEDDVSIDDVVPPPITITEECLEGSNEICFRIIGSYRYPVKIRVELDRNAPIVTTVTGGRS
ncbi:MAG: hypothetical protein JSV63_02935 [Candidatus Aenigmatarchaeota archaeon]|nr:MAG: hypothetical protein JSV63_02935 [Candidatus Aenigmarchaeota archaeon]